MKLVSYWWSNIERIILSGATTVMFTHAVHIYINILAASPNFTFWIFGYFVYFLLHLKTFIEELEMLSFWNAVTKGVIVPQLLFLEQGEILIEIVTRKNKKHKGCWKF